jgi:glycosyltransferase involved in cell wall biosynthesis
MQIISALRKAGHHVTYSMSLETYLAKQHAHRVLPQLTAEERWACENHAFPEIILNRFQPDIAIYCNVNGFRTVARFARDIVQIIDSYGPLHLEGLLVDAPDGEAAMSDAALLESRCRAMVEKLRNADYLITVSERQKYFWSAYCSMAGFSLSELNVLVCPASFEIDPVTRKPADQLTVVYSGGFYPWQKPDRFLRTAASILEEIPGARFHIFGGPHAGLPNEAEVHALLRDLQRFSCVKYHGYRPAEELLETLSTAWCALELMERNIERELAITGRTLEFLSSGTPVIYNDYSTLSNYIARYNAGWTLSTEDPASGLRFVFQELANGGRPLVDELSANARHLAASEFAPARSMTALVDLCNQDLKKRATSTCARAGLTGRNRNSLGRILAISPDGWALRELRITNPLRSLQRQGYADGVVIAPISLENLRNDGRKYDIIITQRTVPEALYYILSTLSLPFVVDVDDNLLAQAAYRAREATEPGLLTALRNCAVLTVPNPRLAFALEKYSGIPLWQKAFVTPNAVPFPTDSCNRQILQPSQIMWIQSDIAALVNSRTSVVNAVEDFSTKYQLPVALIGRNVLHRPQFTHQRELGELEFGANLQMLQFAPTSIGVAPLETDADEQTLDFVAGKSDLKMVLFAGFGHPGVYSSSPPYRESPLQRHSLYTIGNSYSEWMEALEYQYREGWKTMRETTEQIQKERHIDRIARESWLPALQCCRLSKPVRGGDIYEAYHAALQMDATSFRLATYTLSSGDILQASLTSQDFSPWMHYLRHGQIEGRRLIFSHEAHSQAIERLARESVHYSANAFKKIKELGSVAAIRDNTMELARMQTEIARQQAEIGRLESEKNTLQTVISGITRSRSWRLTAPLRKWAQTVRAR